MTLLRVGTYHTGYSKIEEVRHGFSYPRAAHPTYDTDERRGGTYLLATDLWTLNQLGSEHALLELAHLLDLTGCSAKRYAPGEEVLGRRSLNHCSQRC